MRKRVEKFQEGGTGTSTAPAALFVWSPRTFFQDALNKGEEESNVVGLTSAGISIHRRPGGGWAVYWPFPDAVILAPLLRLDDPHANADRYGMGRRLCPKRRQGVVFPRPLAGRSP